MFPYITLSGSPYECGYQHGRQAAPQIKCSIATYALLFAHDCGLDWPAAQARARNYLPILTDQTPTSLRKCKALLREQAFTLPKSSP